MVDQEFRECSLVRATDALAVRIEVSETVVPSERPNQGACRGQKGSGGQDHGDRQDLALLAHSVVVQRESAFSLPAYQRID